MLRQPLASRHLNTPATPPPAAPARQPWYRVLYVQVLLAVALGVAVGWLDPALGVALKPLGDAFIKLVKMMIAPIIFCTVVHGLASVSDLRRLGRIGLKTLIYFEVVSTLALVIGLVVVNWLRPGAGFNVDPLTLDPSVAQTYAKRAEAQILEAFFLNIIPATLFDAFVTGDLLQVLLVATVTALALMNLPVARRDTALAVVDRAAEILFGIMGLVVRLAPIGAFGAMAFTIGKYGPAALGKLAQLMAAFYATAGLFVLGVLLLVVAGHLDDQLRGHRCESTGGCRG